MTSLYRHQVQSLEFFRTRPRVFDASDPGTGKTRVAIESFAERRKRGGGAALIVAPRTILGSAWRAEFRKFAPSLGTSIATAEKRVEAFHVDADAYLINHDGIKWIQEQIKRDKNFLKHRNIDTLIVDESGAFKRPESQRSKAMRKVAKLFEHREIMNGTPNPNSVLEIWHQMMILDDGQRLGDSYYAFRMATCTPKQVGPSAHMVKWLDKEGAQEAIAKLIEDITIRHKFEECLDIPENFTYQVPYELSAEQRRAYEQMRKEQMMVVKEQLVTAVNAAVVATKLLQVASGAVYTEAGEWVLVDTERYELVLDLIEQRKYCVVFFLWQHQKEYLINEARKRGITFGVLDGTVSSDREREETVRYFQGGLYRVIFAHPASAAHGLTLTKGTTTIWASPTYNLDHFLQGNKRIYRAGQTEKTETILIIAQDTIEERVYNALMDKKVRMEDLLTMLE